MNKIIVYSKDICPYCQKAKSLLKRYNLQYEEILVIDDKLKEEMMKKSNGRKTVPQIFVGDTHVGGYDDLVKLGDKILSLVKS